MTFFYFLLFFFWKVFYIYPLNVRTVQLNDKCGGNVIWLLLLHLAKIFTILVECFCFAFNFKFLLKQYCLHSVCYAAFTLVLIWVLFGVSLTLPVVTWNVLE